MTRPRRLLDPSRWPVRTRLTVSVTVPAAVALVVVAVAVAGIFSASLVRDLDAQTRAEADIVAGLAGSDRLPATLPVPAGSPLFVQVVAADGTVIAASPSASPVQPLTTRRRSGVDNDELGAYAGAPLRVRVEPAALRGQPVSVVVAAPLRDVRRALAALRVVLLLVVPVLVAVVAWLSWRVAGAALRPVERLRAAAAELAHDPDAPGGALPAVPVDDEVGRLARTLAELLAAVRSLVAQQRSFVADAAHELRSPLASLAMQLDVARAHPATTSVAELVADLAPEVGRLRRLVEDLLVLARIESTGPAHREPLDLRELADADGEAAPVVGDRAALDRLVANVRANAQRHAGTVRLTTSVQAGQVLLDVDDDGPGIPRPDRQRVLDRWVRLDAARASDAGGTGLGLAIVRATARAHGGDVEVLDSPLGGARVRVRLPLDSTAAPG